MKGVSQMCLITVSEKLKGLIQMKGWSNKELAEILETDETVVSGVLNGSKEPSKQFMRKCIDKFSPFLSFDNELFITTEKAK